MKSSGGGIAWVLKELEAREVVHQHHDKSKKAATNEAKDLTLKT
jgi:hypothetical protein